MAGRIIFVYLIGLAVLVLGCSSHETKTKASSEPERGKVLPKKRSDFLYLVIPNNADEPFPSDALKELLGDFRSKFPANTSIFPGIYSEFAGAKENKFQTITIERIDDIPEASDLLMETLQNANLPVGSYVESHKNHAITPSVTGDGLRSELESWDVERIWEKSE